MTTALVFPDLHIGIPTLTADPTVPVSRRTPALIAGTSLETVTVPITGVPEDVTVQVSLNGTATWRNTTRNGDAVSFPVAGSGAAAGTADTWLLPSGLQVWVWLRVITGGTVQVRKSAQPIVTSGVASDAPVVIGNPTDAEGVVYGHGAPGDMTGAAAGTVYIDIDTGIVYQWSETP